MTNPTKAVTFRLAEALGIPVRELRQRVDTRELGEWMAYWRYKADMEEAAIEKARNRPRNAGKKG